MIFATNGGGSKRVLKNRVIYPLFFHTSAFLATPHLRVFHSWFLLKLEYITVWVLCCRLMTDLSCLTVTFLSRNQYRNLFRDIMVGFTVGTGRHTGILTEL